MAFIQCDFSSETLGMGVSVNVLLPQGSKNQLHPVLWLLHGRSDDHTAWMRQTSIERYASERGLAVVMPAAGLSYYQNMYQGLRYADYIDHELPRVMRSFFPLSEAREDNFIAGLSMGGYGAMRSALLYPERYAEFDLLAQLKRAKEAGTELPRLFACCGGDDFILEHSRAFARQCNESEIALKYIENEGDHNWAYWDHMIREALNWMFYGE